MNESDEDSHAMRRVNTNPYAFCESRSTLQVYQIVAIMLNVFLVFFSCASRELPRNPVVVLKFFGVTQEDQIADIFFGYVGHDRA